MIASISAKDIRENISITSFLSRLGYRPAKISAEEHFYHSIFRNERTASLLVNEKLGVWFDHGEINASNIRGGSIIDMAMAYWHPISLPEALEKIQQTMGEVNIAESKGKQERKRSIPKNRSYELREIKSLGETFGITSYLQSRGIWGVADEALVELHYYIEKDKKRKNFFAAGWLNENQGWEIRNRYFKGCLGSKGMTFIEGAKDKLSVFEGYFDYLSYKYENEDIYNSILVLNSLVFLDKAIERCRDYKEIEVYFDNDTAGKAATEQLLRSEPKAVDCSGVYKGFKDYNDKICHDIRKFIRENKRRFNPFDDLGFNSQLSR